MTDFATFMILLSEVLTAASAVGLIIILICDWWGRR